MTEATTEKTPRIGGVPDKALLKAGTTATSPVFIDWPNEGKKFRTRASFTHGTVIDADNNTALITALFNRIIELEAETQ